MFYNVKPSFHSLPLSINTPYQIAFCYTTKHPLRTPQQPTSNHQHYTVTMLPLSDNNAYNRLLEPFKLPLRTFVDI